MAKAGGPTLDHRWWVDREHNHERAGSQGTTSRPPLRLFQCGEGYDPGGARERLTRSNLRLLMDTSPPPGRWAYVALLEERTPRAQLERVRTALSLPPGSDGVIVDSGKSLRLLITGTPRGERIIELRLGEMSSFDCWVRQEWVREEEWGSIEEALACAPGLIREYLTTGRSEPIL